jgi:hypothetical protein
VTSTLDRSPESRRIAQSPDRQSILPPKEPQSSIARRVRSLANHVFSAGGVVFLISFALYVVVGWLLDVKYHSFNADAFSRMANGFYVLYSRDPHLAAIGFVWNPLQSAADAALLLGNHLWPALSHDDIAGTLVSAAAMAAGAYQIWAALRELGVTRTPIFVLVACFILNPMIVLYGGNGMSEALYLGTLIAAARYLMRWIHRDDLRSLAYAAIALALSYLARNEAAGAAILGAALVWIVSYERAIGVRRKRIAVAFSDFTIFAAPPFIAAAGWAIASYVITGQPFAQFTSQYGNSSQVASSHSKSNIVNVYSTSLHGRLDFEFRAIEALAPLLLLVLVASVAVVLTRRDGRALAPIAVLGGAMGFDMLSYLDDKIFPWLRFFIPAIPLEVLLVGCLVAAIQNPRTGMTPETLMRRKERRAVGLVRTLVGTTLVLIILAPGFQTVGAAMMNPKLGILEEGQLGFIFHSHPSANDVANKNYYSHILAMDSYLEGLHLPDGDVIVDNGTVCVPTIIVTIDQPKLFVIPNDRDFQRILADPLTFHSHYILEIDPSGAGYTAIGAQYPTLWRTGDGFTTLVHKFPAGGSCSEFRLFRVVGHPGQVS